MSESGENIVRTRAPGEDRAAKGAVALHMLRRPTMVGRGSLEGGADVDLSDARIADSLAATADFFARALGRAGARRAEVAGRQAALLAAGSRAISKLANDGDAAALDTDEFSALEAIVVADGSRPSLFVQDGRVDPTVPEAKMWSPLIADFQTSIATVARSVGRINFPLLPPYYVGTGFVVAPGLIATNRHVLQAIARQDTQGQWVLATRNVTVDFAAEYQQSLQRRFRVTGVPYAGPEWIGQDLDPRKLDLALLTVDTDHGNDPFPAPLPLLSDLKPLRPNSEVYVMGFPAQPAAGQEGEDTLQMVFQDEYDVKRFAPGYVLQKPDDIDDGGPHRVFTHDSSTLRGNSGSCVVEFRRKGKGVVGIHFGGFQRDENYAHAISRLADILKNQGVTLV